MAGKEGSQMTSAFLSLVTQLATLMNVALLAFLMLGMTKNTYPGSRSECLSNYS